jgi:hypothetical protein
MVKTRNRLVAAFLTLAMLLNFSAPLAAYADGEGENTGEEQSNSIELKWTGSFTFTNFPNCSVTGLSIVYPNGVSSDDRTSIETRLSDILNCESWKYAYEDGNTIYYPTAELPVLDVNGTPILDDEGKTKTQTFNSGKEFIDYVNTTLLANAVGANHYRFAYEFAPAGTQSGKDVGDGSSTGTGNGTLGGGTIGGDNIGGGVDNTDGDDDSNIPFTVTPSSDDGEGSGSVSEPDTALGVVAAPSAESDVVSDLVTAAGLLTVAAQLALVFTWDILPIHQVEGTLTDANGAAVANARVTLEKNGQTVKTVTTDASGHFKAYVPQGEYNLFATRGEESAIYTAYTPDEGTSAELMLA